MFEAFGIVFALIAPACGIGETAPTTPTSVEVTFVVGCPAGEPVDSQQIYCVFSIDGWNPKGRPVSRTAAGTYVGTLTLPSGEPIEYKFVREPRWSAVEKAADGGEVANRQLMIPQAKSAVIVVHKVERWADQPPAIAPFIVCEGETAKEAIEVQSTVTGQVRIHDDFPVVDHPDKRTLRVYLPPNYDAEPDRRYPVLYMHDGQNLFDASTSYSGVEWKVDEILERLIREGRVQPIMVVGIDNTPGRMDEYTPFIDASLGGGKADAYLDFVIQRVKPFIDQTYRTLPQREHTALGGASLGGLASLYGVLSHKDVFGSAAAMSTSLMWADWRIVGYVEHYQGPCPIRLWLDVDKPPQAGNQQIGQDRLGQELVRIREMLATKSCNTSSNFHFDQPAGPHHESAWADRFDEVIIHLFPPDGR